MTGAWPLGDYGSIRGNTVKKQFLILAACVALGACAHSSSIVVGQEREAIDPEDVKIYLDPPPGYEKVAVLDADSGGSVAITKKGKTAKVVERLKEEAADLGANGVLLTGTGSQFAGAVNSGSAYASGSYAYGTGVSIPTYMATGSAIAIYVPPAAQQALAAPSTYRVSEPSSPLVTTTAIEPQVSGPLPAQPATGDVKTLYKCSKSDGTAVFTSIATEGCVVMGQYSGQ
jgi:hypothetical protein